ncbi:hypothetical protein [Baekduia alba]|uniref:hypothetical protein n=1 Tax=Baekduia alba TaxID=2997333 RepID=UPI002341CC4F|nr:hypothetical protein [Baekduia alba]
MRRLLALTVALLAAASGSASAATWTAPQTVSAPHTFAGPLLTATTFDGSMLAAWPWQDNIGNDALGGEGTASRPSSLTPASFGPEHAAPDGVTAIASFARTQALALAAQGLPSRSPATGVFLSRLNVAFGPAGGGFGATRTLATVPLVSTPRLATSGSTALVTWIEVTKTSTGAIRRVVRAIDRRGGAWGKPYTLSGRGRADVVSAAAGTNGDQVVAFVRQGKVLVRVRRPGHGWGAIRTLATATGPTQWLLGTGVNARGQVRVVWRRHELRVRTALESSALLVGRSTFTKAQTLVADGASSFRLAETPEGWAVADVEGSRPVLHRTTGGSQFAAGQPAAPAQGGTRGADVVFSPAGGLTVAWVQPLANQDSDGVARAASFANGAWSAVEDVSPPEAVHEVRLVADGRAGQPVALWTARPDGTGPAIPTAQIRTVVRSALRRP